MLIFDLETDGLLDTVSKVHTLTMYDTKTQQYSTYDKAAVAEGIAKLASESVLCGHNIIGYDMPVLQKLYPKHRWNQKIIDTLVWARVAYPDIKDLDFKLRHKYELPGKLIGRHSLKAWGYRLGEFKGDFGETTDWKEWSQEMSDYCAQDVKVTAKLKDKLMSKAIASECVKLEHEVANIVQLQEANGFWFDKTKAEKLYVELINRKSELTNQLQQVFKPWYVKGKEFTPKRDNRKRGYTAGATMTHVSLTTFNPSSRYHVAHHLKKLYNWEPTEFTDKGEPQLNDEVLQSLPYPEAKLLAEYFTLDKRLGQLAEGDKAWMKMVGRDHRIHGHVITNGAVTGRMTHINPNIAQVPKAAPNVPYGHECRELFKARPGWVLVGCDASGLELRCLAHYMAMFDKGKYAKVILEGDIHTVNQEAAGLPSRDTAKTFIYGFLYGAGVAKIGSIIGGTPADGTRLRAEFLKRTPGLKKLLKWVYNQVKLQGYLVGLDGRHLKIRSAHSALNTLLQSAGALVMKKALVILYEDLNEFGLRHGKQYAFCANVHDEWQIECMPDFAETIGNLAKKAITKAGEYFAFNCRLDGAYSIGGNWAETH